MISPASNIPTPRAFGEVQSRPESQAPHKQLSAALEDASRARSESAEKLLDLLQGPRSTSVLSTIDSVLNLGADRNLLGSLGDLSREELAESFAILSDLFARGIVGYETREINGEPQKVFIDVAIGSDAHRAPLVKDSRFDRYV